MTAVRLWSVHVWKEWREARFSILLLAVTVAVLSAVGVEAALRMRLPSLSLPATLGLFAAVTTVLVLGGDLLPKDLRDDRRSPLRRLPVGLSRPFVVRVALYFAAIAAVAGLAGSVAGGLLVAKGEDAAQLVAWPVRPLTEALLVLGCWTLAASCWVRQGMLAAPAAATLIALLLVAPLSAPIGHRRLVDFAVDGWNGWVATLCVGGVLAAWASFHRGVRSGRRDVRAIATGVGILLLGCVPLYAAVATRAHDYLTIDPYSQNFQIDGGVISTDGTRAYLRVRRREPDAPTHALFVDLERRTWGVGDVAYCLPVGSDGIGPSFRTCAPVGWVAEWGSRGARLLDANTGEELDDDFSRHTASPEVIARVRDEVRRLTPMRTADGRRAWMFDGALEVEGDGPNDVVRTRFDEPRRFVRPSPRGYRFRDGDRSGLHDIRADVTVWADHQPYPAIATAAGWITRTPERFELHDRDGTRPFDALDPAVDMLVLGLDDGTFLYSHIIERKPRRRMTVRRMDAVTGASWDLHFEDGSPAIVEGVASPGYGARTPAGRPILQLAEVGGRRLARLSADDLTMTRAAMPTATMIASLDEESVIATLPNDRTLIRVFFEGEVSFEILFPIPAESPERFDPRAR